MLGLDPMELAVGAIVALTAGAGILVCFSYWWKNDKKKQLQSSGAGISPAIAPNQNGIKYDIYKLGGNAHAQNGQHSTPVNEGTVAHMPRGAKESKYMQIVHEVQTKLDDERSKREAVELRCSKYAREVESLTVEHNALQDSHEKLLKQYNSMSDRLKVTEERHKRLRDALCRLDIPAEMTHTLFLDNDEDDHDTDIDIDDSGRETGRYPRGDLDLGEESDDLDLESLDSGAQSESETSHEVEFELTENVMHALISRDSVTELLTRAPPEEDYDDLSDLVYQNQLDDEEEEVEDTDDLVINNRSYFQEEEEEEREEKLRKQQEHNNNDVNQDHLRPVNSTRIQFEKRASPCPPPRGDLSSSSSNNSSNAGSQNDIDLAGESLDDLLVASPGVKNLIRTFEKEPKIPMDETLPANEISTSWNDVSQE